MNADIFVLIEHLQGQVSELSYVLLAQARKIVQPGGKTIAILLGKGIDHLTLKLDVDEAWIMDDPALVEFTGEAYTQALSSLIEEQQPRLVLLGDSTIGSDVAGILSIRLGLPLISSCRQIREDAGCLTAISSIFGGKMFAEEVVPLQTSLVMMTPGGFRIEEGTSTTPPLVKQLPSITFKPPRVNVRKYIQPPAGDVDISREPVLIGIGRGVQREDNLELVEELATALSGTVCATRPVVDQGWVNPTRLVGKSGKAIKPKLYLALGISGAPEHTEAITGSEQIIAINTDPAAPIFNLARFGAQVDMIDLLPVLTEKINQAK